MGGLVLVLGWSGGAGGPARSALMQRGARFFQKQYFPCSVALVLGRGGGASVFRQSNKTDFRQRFPNMF